MPMLTLSSMRMPDLPAHASPSLPPLASPRPTQLSSNVSYLDLHGHATAPHPPLISPAVTPPSTPALTAPAPKLLNKLPEVRCIVRARIPTTTGQEMFLHLYQNNVDNKEHLAIVFGHHIRSRSLDAPQPGETEKDRMIRGAYVGRLYPGRTSSRVEDATASPLHRSLYQSRASSATSTPGSTRPSSPSPSPRHLVSETPNTGAPLVRIHSECYTGETVWSARCDCGEQLDEAARLMSLPSADADGGGVIIYLRQEGRGIGLGEKLKAYNLQDLGSDTVEANLLLRHPADARSYGLATAMLVDLGLGGDRGIRLLTNNPEKVRAVEGPGREVKVRERVPMVPLAWSSEGREGVRSPEVGQYLRTKIEKMGHLLSDAG